MALSWERLTLDIILDFYNKFTNFHSSSITGTQPSNSDQAFPFAPISVIVDTTVVVFSAFSTFEVLLRA